MNKASQVSADRLLTSSQKTVLAVNPAPAPAGPPAAYATVATALTPPGFFASTMGASPANYMVE